MTWWVAAVAALSAAAMRVIKEGHQWGLDTAEYLAAAQDMLGPGSVADERYPLGYPALLAGADLAGLPAWTVTTASGLALVGAIWWAAVKLGGPIAGIAAGVFCLLSDLTGEAGVLLMSDTPAALFVVAALVAVIYGRSLLAGVLLGASAWVRFPHVVFAVASTRWRMACGALVVLGGLVLYNTAVVGTPAGYPSGQVSWSLDYATDAVYLDNMETPYGNLYYYASVLGGQWGLLVPFVPLAAGVELWRRWPTPEARFATVVCVVNLGVYIFYFYQSARFVLSTASVLIVFAAAWVARMLSDIRQRVSESSVLSNGGLASVSTSDARSGAQTQS